MYGGEMVSDIARRVLRGDMASDELELPAWKPTSALSEIYRRMLGGLPLCQVLDISIIE